MTRAKKVFENEDRKELYEQWKKGRSPVNFDCDNVEQVLRTAKFLKYFFHNHRVQYRISASGKGVHFRVLDKRGKQLYLPTRLVLMLRKNLDDPSRLKWDELKFKKKDKLRPVGLLFNGKNGRKAGEWKDFNSVGQVLMDLWESSRIADKVDEQ